MGLPPGQMGNSEVGHQNLGAGRITYQDFMRINRAIRDGAFFRNPVLLKVMGEVRRTGGRAAPDGPGLRRRRAQHIEHLFALLELARQQGMREQVSCTRSWTDATPRRGAALATWSSSRRDPARGHGRSPR